jgi:hypothetical protein
LFARLRIADMHPEAAERRAVEAPFALQAPPDAREAEGSSGSLSTMRGSMICAPM